MYVLLELITTIFKRDSDNQIFLNGEVLFNGS